MESTSLKEKLILAGLQEIRRHGLQDFSLRKISAACGVSCAAPYKHFRDKQDFFLEVILYINKQWRDHQLQVLKQLGEDASTRDKLVEIAMAYIRFLMDNPHFRSILLVRDRGMTPEYIRAKAGLSSVSHTLIQQYCAEVGMTQEDRIRKTFVVRSYIYGASLMLDSEELAYSPKTMEMIRSLIQREFALP